MSVLYPVFPVSQPAASDGGKLANGRLGPCDLTPVYFVNVGHLSMQHQAARAWAWVVALCLQETGCQMTAVSAGDVYRSLEAQTTVFHERYTPTYDPKVNTLDDGRIGPDGKRWYKRKGVAAVASIGDSNHGLGLAVDVAVDSVLTVRRTGDDRGITAAGNGAALDWLKANAVSLGFSWETQAEAWHIRYFAGDTIPQRVLECEAWVAAQAA